MEVLKRVPEKMRIAAAGLVLSLLLALGLVSLEAQNAADWPMCSAGQILKRGSTGWECATESGGGGGGALSYANAKLTGGDVSMASADTWYDGPSISLEAGTWLVLSQMQFNRTTTTAVQWTSRITDGTTHYASAQHSHASLSGHHVSIPLHAVVTLTETTTIKAQGAAATSSTAQSMLMATTSNSSGQNATQISAVRIAP
jgi:hypothetical protein